MDEKKGFRCPDIVPPFAPDDFCIPKDCCPDRLETLKFPGPTSCLPEETLQQLELRIDAANKFLLDLALSEDKDKNEGFKQVFDGLFGQIVEVELDCPAAVEKNATLVRGRVQLVGKDFTILSNKKTLLLLPHEKIRFINPLNRFAEPIDSESLMDIDPCLRRCITYRFGDIVSGSPELIQIFFRLRLTIYLLQAIDKELHIILEEEKVKGTLSEVEPECLTICVGEENKVVNVADICLIEMEDCQF